MRVSLTLAGAALALALGATGQAARQDVYALVGGRVVTVSGPALESGTVGGIL